MNQGEESSIRFRQRNDVPHKQVEKQICAIQKQNPESSIDKWTVVKVRNVSGWKLRINLFHLDLIFKKIIKCNNMLDLYEIEF